MNFAASSSVTLVEFWDDPCQALGGCSCQITISGLVRAYARTLVAHTVSRRFNDSGAAHGNPSESAAYKVK